MKSSQKGFTLLELLVVVAILAAIAGTAAIALQDTDARASAAAHVAMMDELNKGVATYRVLHKNVYPDGFDSLAYVEETTGATGGASTALILPNADGDIFGVSADDIKVAALPTGIQAAVVKSLKDIGIENLRYIAEDADVPEDVDANGCEVANLQDTIRRRNNAVVAGNIFNGKAGNGCGVKLSIAADSKVAYWTGSLERILGPGEYADAQWNGTTFVSDGAAEKAVAPVLMAVGFGPAADLFKPEILGSMTSVPVYRHVREDQYNRFIGLFRIAEGVADDADGWTIRPTEQVLFVGVIDGAGDTKEEELGEWDGTRSTI
jgi:prepilin-type N-terminal cleavage/methylation domain-containing protein